MSTNTEGILIIAILIAIVLVSGGGIFNHTNDTNRALTERDRQERLYSYDDSNTSNPSSQTNTSPAKQIKSISKNVDKLADAVHEYIEEQNASIYKGKVTISTIRDIGTFTTQITLNTYIYDDQPINITGWKLRSTVTGNQSVIGGATHIPHLNSSRNEQPIIVFDRAKIVVSQNRSPINTSFRTNSCVGYLAQSKNFDPPLKNSCPNPSDDAPPLSNRIESDCLDYIDDLYSCEIPNKRNFPENITNSCKSYLETEINYEGCVSKHSTDLDFLKNEWRVFTNQPTLWREDREHIELIDEYGKIVDSITY